MPFILTAANNYDLNGFPISAQRAFEDRISENRWFIYQGTRNRTVLDKGDKILFYLSGRKLSPQIAAKGNISRIRSPRPDELTTEVQGVVHSVLEFENIQRLNPPIDFRSALQTLSFAPKNMKKWGVVVLGGCRKISVEDYEKILNFA